MSNGTTASRIRAWMIVFGEFTDKEALKVLALDKARLDEYVVVRVDLVQSLCDRGPAMVIPLDTMDGGEESRYRHLHMIRDMIAEELGFDPEDCEAYDLLEVQSWHPTLPPHTATGYITKAEAIRAVEEGERGGKPGRQDNSPGFNPWG